MKYIIRDKSVITGKKNLEHLYTFKDFPVFMGCLDRPDRTKDLVADMSFSICRDTGVIQLDKLLPLDVLYQEQHVDGTGPTWQKYYKDFAGYLLPHRPKNVLEIGGGKGDIAEITTRLNPAINWTIIEPNPLHGGSERIRIIPGFFDKQFKTKDRYDTVVFSQLMEHVYDPGEFLKTIYDFLIAGDKLIFAYPNLEIWLKKKFTNAINFEHTFFLTDYFVDYLLLKHGFKILDKTFYGEHSVFYVAEKSSSNSRMPKYENKYKEYKNIFESFINYYKDIVGKMNSEIGKFDGDVFLFGAHIFSQYLLNFGLEENRIKAILDNSSLKQKKRLYGTNLWVYPLEIIKGNKNAAVILKAGIYQEEIRKQLQEINKYVTILE